MKTCTKCGIPQPDEDFNSDNRRKDGKRASCRACDSLQKKQIREDNLDEYRRRNAENNRKYRQKLYDANKQREESP